MSVKVAVTNRQAVCRVHPARLKRLTAYFMQRVEALTPRRHWRDVHVVLTADAEIANVNERFLKHAGATDVISFCYEAMSGNQEAVDAEILVNVQRALAVGPCFGGVSRELALYVAHGCDHLSGANDRTAKQRRRMRQRELRWRRKAEALGLMTGLMGPEFRHRR